MFGFFLLSLAGTMILFEIRMMTGRAPIAHLFFIDSVAENSDMKKNLEWQAIFPC